MTLEQYANLAAHLFEFAGITVIVLGALWAPLGATLDRRRGDTRPAFKLVRRSLASSILVGIELLVGADIILSISHAPELRQVLVLGLIIVIRTFLSITLDVELEGTWPWRRNRQGA